MNISHNPPQADTVAQSVNLSVSASLCENVVKGTDFTDWIPLSEGFPR
jgi:hypothetical protein